MIGNQQCNSIHAISAELIVLQPYPVSSKTASSPSRSFPEAPQSSGQTRRPSVQASPPHCAPDPSSVSARLISSTSLYTDSTTQQGSQCHQKPLLSRLQ